MEREVKPATGNHRNARSIIASIAFRASASQCSPCRRFLQRANFRRKAMHPNSPPCRHHQSATGSMHSSVSFLTLFTARLTA